ncbi:ComEC/Rec2 family competence protein [Aquibacillus salsiterrae]|uniref:MBL fold metallo-hydrolase n=1 Tax=Aquibacillus salsiterrae TaxID=2950439 RepID=A0A9X3WDC5_9BACI|nr:hypothetical protein [Aquibacillus salsiterrae]MDC3415349.1 hypothetical protein [Aquibacillus salsiterrae]
MKHQFKYVWIVLLIFIAFILMETFPLVIEAEPLPMIKKDEVYFTFFQLKDGESTYIQGTDGKNILINTGSPLSEEDLIFQLEELDVKSIDKLILTRQTSDYCGNTSRLIERYRISEVIYAGGLSFCNTQTEGLTKIKWAPNDSHVLIDHLNFKVLDAEANGDMSLEISYGKTSLLYLTHSELDAEDDILKQSIDPQIIKIGDYARGKSPSSYFLSKIDPHMSIVFTCKKCKPNEGLIERLNESWIDVYQLNRVGTTIIRMDLQDYEILS